MSTTANDAKMAVSQRSYKRDYVERPFFGNEFITFVDVDYEGRNRNGPSRDIHTYETRPDGRLVAGSKRAARAHAIAKEAQTSAAEMDVDLQPEDTNNAGSQQGGTDGTLSQSSGLHTSAGQAEEMRDSQ